MTDLRAYRVVVVANQLSTEAAVLEWAHAQGYGVYQLPLPGFAFASVTGDTRDADRAALAFVASQLAVYVQHDYEVVGVLLRDEHPEDPREREWLVDLFEVAAEAGVTLPVLQSVAS